MSKHQQHRFPRLAIVGPTEKGSEQQTAGLQWWGPRHSRGLSLQQATYTTQIPPRAIRMAVMPTLSRNLWFVVIARTWNILCSYFATRTERRPGASVLSFRRNVGTAAAFRRATAQADYASKKPNGNVGWNSDCEATPQKGGRG